jgi:NAD(P)H-nitrite reductase large subunit
VVAVVEAAPRPGSAQLGALATMLATAPSLVRDGLRYHLRRRVGGAEMIHGSAVASVTRTDRGLVVQLDGARRSFEVDVLCLGYGFEPANELLRVLGCGHEVDPVRRQLVTRRDAFGRTDIAGIYALGDCTGLGGARAALAEGTIVGFSVAQDLGRAIDIAQRDRARTMLRRHRRFQRALWDLYAAPPYSFRRATAETVICRCEEVTLGQIEQALAEKIASAGAIKRRTRLGMGRCQGRYCAPLLEALLAERLGTERGAFTGFAPRVPVKPIPIGELVR